MYSGTTAKGIKLAQHVRKFVFGWLFPWYSNTSQTKIACLTLAEKICQWVFHGCNPVAAQPMYSAMLLKNVAPFKEIYHHESLLQQRSNRSNTNFPTFCAKFILLVVPELVIMACDWDLLGSLVKTGQLLLREGCRRNVADCRRTLCRGLTHMTCLFIKRVRASSLLLDPPNNPQNNL